METNYLWELSWEEAATRLQGSDTVILPVGANEQHGPQNPLGTDFLVAEALAKEVSGKTGILALPVVPFGVSSHHRQFPGTIAITPAAFKGYMRDIFLSLHNYGIRKMLVVNGHGGNRAALVEVARELREEGRLFVVITQWWDISRALLPKLWPEEERSHAGSEESSVVLSLFPKLSRLKRVGASTDRPRFSWEKLANLPYDSIDFTSSGVWERIRTVSADRGRQVLEVVVGELCKIAEDLKVASWQDLKPKPMRETAEKL